MKSSKVTMQNIADKLGISKVSVSKAIRNQPDIGEDLKRKILQTANEMGYFNERQSLVSKIERFAFLVPKRFFLENENFYTTIYYYLNKKCLNNNLNLSLFVINSAEEKDLTIPAALNNLNIGGLLLAGEIDEAYLFALSNLNIPMLSIDFYKPHLQIDCILTDNFYISYSATTHLIDKGHRKIGFVGNPKQTSSIMDRYFGFQKALAFNNLSFSEDWNIINNDPISGRYTLDFSLPEELPTAFVCHCDMAAYFLIQKLLGMGLNVPDDVSIVSFDNTEISRTCSPKLTTVDINKKDFAYMAFDQMMKRVQCPELPPQRIFINAEFIERQSVKNRNGQ